MLVYIYSCNRYVVPHVQSPFKTNNCHVDQTHVDTPRTQHPHIASIMMSKYTAMATQHIPHDPFLIKQLTTSLMRLHPRLRLPLTKILPKCIPLRGNSSIILRVGKSRIRFSEKVDIRFFRATEIPTAMRLSVSFPWNAFVVCSRDLWLSDALCQNDGRETYVLLGR